MILPILGGVGTILLSLEDNDSGGTTLDVVLLLFDGSVFSMLANQSSNCFGASGVSLGGTVLSTYTLLFGISGAGMFCSMLVDWEVAFLGTSITRFFCFVFITISVLVNKKKLRCSYVTKFECFLLMTFGTLL